MKVFEKEQSATGYSLKLAMAPRNTNAGAFENERSGVDKKWSAVIKGVLSIASLCVIASCNESEGTSKNNTPTTTSQSAAPTNLGRPLVLVKGYGRDSAQPPKVYIPREHHWTAMGGTASDGPTTENWQEVTVARKKIAVLMSTANAAICEMKWNGDCYQYEASECNTQC